MSWPPETFKKSRKILHHILKNFGGSKRPILIVGTANDTDTDLECKDMVILLELMDFRDRIISCFSTSSRDGSNIREIEKWIKNQAPSFWSTGPFY